MTEGAKVSFYGYDGAAWRAVLVDSLGHLQVDVLTSALPTGAPNYGQANILNQRVSSVYGVLNTRLPSALDTDSLKIREQGTPSVHLYGYDGANWQTLMVDHSVYKNLKVALYYTDQLIHGLLWPTTDIVTTDLYTLRTSSQVYLWRSASRSDPCKVASEIGDASGGRYHGTVALVGWNGATYDRLRTYGTGVLKVGRAEIGATLTRETGAGSVATGARKLFWLTIRPSAANWVLALTDATAGGGTVIWDDGGALQEPCHCVFDPPIEFSTGIYIETYTNLTAVMLDYI